MPPATFVLAMNLSDAMLCSNDHVFRHGYAACPVCASVFVFPLTRYLKALESTAQKVA